MIRFVNSLQTLCKLFATLDNFLTTFWQLFDNFLTTFFWKLFDNFLTTFWQHFDIYFLLFYTMWHNYTFVTPQVFPFIGPSNDGRRHGRGTYLFCMLPMHDTIVSHRESYLVSSFRSSPVDCSGSIPSSFSTWAGWAVVLCCAMGTIVDRIDGAHYTSSDVILMVRWQRKCRVEKFFLCTQTKSNRQTLA
jgi:hypothetical protein